MTEEYLDKLDAQLKEKDLYDFWIMAERADFKPLEERNPDKVLRKIKKNPGKYQGKTIANVILEVNKKELKNDGYVFMFKIGVFRVHEDGSIDKKRGDSWGLKVNYKLEDLATRKFKLKDLHKIINYCGAGILHNDDFNGASFKNFMKMLKNKQISLDD